VSLLQGLQIGMPDQRGRRYVQREFLAHYYEGQEAPSHAYASEDRPWRNSDRLPAHANFFSQAPGFRTSSERVASGPSAACLSSPAPHSNTGLEKNRVPFGETPGLRRRSTA